MQLGLRAPGSALGRNRVREHGQRLREVDVLDDDAVRHRPVYSWTFDHCPLADGMRALDVGCGGGAILELSRRFPSIRVDGVDASEESVAMCRRRVLPLVFSSGAGCESRQTIGIVTFCGLLVATVVGISFPPAYFALFSRFGGNPTFHVRP